MMQREVPIDILAQKIHARDRHLSFIRWHQLSEECKEYFMQKARESLNLPRAPLQRVKPVGFK